MMNAQDVVQTMEKIGFTNIETLPSPVIADHYVALPDVVSTLRFGTTFTFDVFVTLSTGMIHVVDNGVSCVNRPFDNTSQSWLEEELRTIFAEFGAAPTATEVLGEYLQNYRPAPSL